MNPYRLSWFRMSCRLFVGLLVLGAGATLFSIVSRNHPHVATTKIDTLHGAGGRANPFAIIDRKKASAVPAATDEKKLVLSRYSLPVKALAFCADGRHPGWWYWQWSGQYSILGGPATRFGVNGYGGTTLTHVTSCDGASNTLLLAHKGVAPKYYSGGSPDLDGPTDKSWAAGGSWEHTRAPWLFVADSDHQVMEEYLGGRHPSAMPVLFADGSVRVLRYDLSTDLLPKLWAWNDGAPVANDCME